MSPLGAPAGPLSGRTVVVTRAGPRAQGLADALRAVGARVLELPLTEQVEAADGGAALRAAAATMRDWAWVVLTSVNAVERLVAALRDVEDLRSVRVAAVGPATADALRRAGVEPALVPTEHSARGLVADFPEADPRPGPDRRAAAGAGVPRRVLFPCADLAPDTVPAGLAGKGWEVRRVEAYRTVPREPPAPDVVAELRLADALVLTAASAARAFGELRDAAGAPLRSPRHVVCIGPSTAAAARSAGMAGVHEAAEPSPEGIVAELVAHVGAAADDGS